MSEDWTEKARSRIAAGERIIEVARSLSVSERNLRRQLNIGGAGDQDRESRRARRAVERAEIKGVRVRVEVSAPRDRSGASGYADKPQAEPTKITLPRISLPMLPDEVRPRTRKAPPPRVSVNAGAERYRAVRQRMIREGKIVEPGVIEEFRP